MIVDSLRHGYNYGSKQQQQLVLTLWYLITCYLPNEQANSKKENRKCNNLSSANRFRASNALFLAAKYVITLI